MLQLDVPAEAFGGKGMLTFGIPRAKITAADELPPAAAAAAAACGKAAGSDRAGSGRQTAGSDRAGSAGGQTAGGDRAGSARRLGRDQTGTGCQRCRRVSACARWIFPGKRNKDQGNNNFRVIVRGWCGGIGAKES